MSRWTVGRCCCYPVHGCPLLCSSSCWSSPCPKTGHPCFQPAASSRPLSWTLQKIAPGQDIGGCPVPATGRCPSGEASSSWMGETSSDHHRNHNKSSHSSADNQQTRKRTVSSLWRASLMGPKRKLPSAGFVNFVKSDWLRKSQGIDDVDQSKWRCNYERVTDTSLRIRQPANPTNTSKRQ